MGVVNMQRGELETGFGLHHISFQSLAPCALYSFPKFSAKSAYIQFINCAYHVTH